MVLINYSLFVNPENKMHKKLLLIVELPFISSNVLYWRKIQYVELESSIVAVVAV